MSAMADQVIQLAGAVLILAAFAGIQAGRLGPKSLGYLLTNIVGSAALGAAAVPGHQWGFLLLEGAWSMTSLVGVVTLLTRPSADGKPAQRTEPARPEQTMSAPARPSS